MVVLVGINLPRDLDHPQGGIGNAFKKATSVSGKNRGTQNAGFFNSGQINGYIGYISVNL